MFVLINKTEVDIEAEYRYNITFIGQWQLIAGVKQSTAEVVHELIQSSGIRYTTNKLGSVSAVFILVLLCLFFHDNYLHVGQSPEQYEGLESGQYK